jgi:UDP-N-acetylmuramoylalanine--D-glutamate ligase
MIAVTGTNGKSTTAFLIYQMLQHAGQRTFIGGNFGNPLIGAADQDWDYVVVEVSSFQLETISSFRPHISILLNITEDHLDRHGDMSKYQAIKQRIFDNQFPREWAIVNGDDKLCMEAVNRSRPSKLAFSLTQVDCPIYFQDNAIHIAQGPSGEPLRFDLKSYPLRGQHNVSNLMATIATGMIIGLDYDCLEHVIEHAKAPAHRLEHLGKFEDVQYVNDSKSTTIASTLEAIRAFKEPVILILGGRSKGRDFSQLFDALQSSVVKEVVAYGEAASDIQKALLNADSPHVAVEKPFVKALELAQSLAQPGNTVLLSPAATSQDQFVDFEARGERFKQFVEELMS